MEHGLLLARTLGAAVSLGAGILNWGGCLMVLTGRRLSGPMALLLSGAITWGGYGFLVHLMRSLGLGLCDNNSLSNQYFSLACNVVCLVFSLAGCATGMWTMDTQTVVFLLPFALLGLSLHGEDVVLQYREMHVKKREEFTDPPGDEIL